MYISSACDVVIEVTRRCNMCCAHCLRGDAEAVDIQERYIDAFLDSFANAGYISSLTFTGGEISLNIPAIRYTYCDDKDDYSCGLCISSDDFHEEIPCESASILSGLRYNRNDKVTDFRKQYLINEGRAKTINANQILKREPIVSELVIEYERDCKPRNEAGINITDGELYLNAIGDVVVGCDWSYESQRKYRIGNVMDEKWLENIRSSKLCIEENS